MIAAHRNLLSLHSDSDSDTETTDLPLNTTGRNSTSLSVITGGSSSSGGIGNTANSSSNNNTLSGGGVASGIVSTSSNVLSTIVEFGSNLFRPDSKKSIRNKRSTTNSLSNSSVPPINPIDNLETIAIHEANLEREYLSACYPVARCIAAIEKQENGLATHVSKKFVIILSYVIANFDNFQPELINIKLLEIDKQIEFFMCFFFVMHIKLHLNQYEFRKIIFTIPFYSVTWYSEGLVVVSLQMFTKLFFSCNVTLYEVMRKFK